VLPRAGHALRSRRRGRPAVGASLAAAGRNTLARARRVVAARSARRMADRLPSCEWLFVRRGRRPSADARQRRRYLPLDTAARLRHPPGPFGCPTSRSSNDRSHTPRALRSEARASACVLRGGRRQRQSGTAGREGDRPHPFSSSTAYRRRSWRQRLTPAELGLPRVSAAAPATASSYRRVTRCRSSTRSRMPCRSPDRRCTCRSSDSDRGQAGHFRPPAEDRRPADHRPFRR
jgi:hypothetical protein